MTGDLDDDGADSAKSKELDPFDDAADSAKSEDLEHFVDLRDDQTAIARPILDLRADDFDDDETTVASAVRARNLEQGGSPLSRSGSVPPKITISKRTESSEPAGAASLRDRLPEESEPWVHPGADQLTGPRERATRAPARFGLLRVLVAMLIVVAVIVYLMWPDAETEDDGVTTDPAAALIEDG